MANLKEIKNKALRRAQIHSSEKEAGQSYEDDLRKIREMEQRVKNERFVNELAKRRLLAGLEVIKAEVKERKAHAEALYAIGEKVKRNAAGQLSREEKRIIKAEMKDVKQATKTTKQTYRWVGKERDAQRKKVSSYLSKQRMLAYQLVSGTIDLYEALQQSGRVV